MKGRFVALSLVLAVAAAARADDDEVKLLRKQIAELRAAKEQEISDLRDRLAKEQDRGIEMARAADRAKRDSADSLEKAQKDMAQLDRDLTIAKVRIANLEKQLAE